MEAINEILKNEPHKIIISNPIDKTEKCRKIVIKKVADYYQAEKHNDKKVYHSKIDDIYVYLTDAFEQYKQCTALTNNIEYSLKVSKKGEVLLSKKTIDSQSTKSAEHNRQKNYILKEGLIIPPLVDIGVFTPDGRVVKSMYSKYKQINRFLELINDYVSKLPQNNITLLDFGCGKSYLSFILYYYFKEIKKIDIKIIGLDLKEDVVDNCNSIARKYGYEGLSFEVGDIMEYSNESAVDIVVCLHACDIATDYALFNAVKWNAKMIFAVPCCQHELNEQIKTNEYSILTKYGLIKERVSALVTDAIRANLLISNSYRTQVLEFVDFEHSPKNIMIRAIKANISVDKKTKAIEEVERICKEFNLKPMLKSLFEKD